MKGKQGSPNPLSVMVIVKNEEAVLARCLESVSWADEIVVLDSGSNDRTLEIARKYTDKLYIESDWQGFGVQKNRALERCSNEWILSLDADEWLDPVLAEEIRDFLAEERSSDLFAVELLRRSSYLGKWMKWGGWGKDWLPRLFRKSRCEFSNSLVHERLLVDGAIERIRKGVIWHESFRTLEEVIEKINHYSTLGAEQRYREGRKGSGVARAVAGATWAFFRTYVLRLGFLDGKHGFMLAVSNAEGVYYRYLKMMLLEADADKER